jgi:hypothetical protein
MSLLTAIRDLFSRLPETYHLERWELQHVLFSLGYADDLPDEAEIAAATEVARTGWPQWRAALLRARLTTLGCLWRRASWPCLVP